MYTASKERYTTMEYDHCGNSGLMLPKVSLGLWHNFGDTANFKNMRKLCFTAFDSGITQFDLANNYGPESGSAEKNFGRILKEDLCAYRDAAMKPTGLMDTERFVLMENTFTPPNRKIITKTLLLAYALTTLMFWNRTET